MAKQYTGSLSLEWFNKQKSIIALNDNSIKSDSDIPAPKINWINKEESLFYEISEKGGIGHIPYWVNRDDIRVKEARPLVFQKAYNAIAKNVEGTIPGTQTKFELEILEKEEDAIAIDNLLIKGDNLLALNALKKHFENLKETEKVKCIYIDPPYNVGAAFEQYDDNLEHSEWLTLTRDRLILLRDLLAEDGSMWISIDDKEMAYMKILLDEIFGRESFVACNVWQKRYSRENRQAIGDVHEYILVYAKNVQVFKLLRNLVPPTEDQVKVYRNPNNDPKGRWRPIPLTAQAGHATKEQFYEIVTPSGKVHTPPEGRCWGVSKSTFERLAAEGRIYYGQNNDSQPNLIRYLSEVEGFAPWTWWPSDEVGHTDEAKKEMHTIFGKENAFDTPKPERLIERILHIATGENDLILDCFGGSGTTFSVAHKMKRKWIGVEIGDHADTHIIPRLLKTLTAEINVGIDDKVKWNGGGSFKYFHLGKSIISIDKETQKGEFNWSLGKLFIQESLLLSYDFILQHGINLFPAQLFQNEIERPTLGKISNNNKSLYGVAFLAEPTESNLTITSEEVKSIYTTLKKQEDFASLVIYTNKGIDIAQDTIPEDLEIIKVPHAVFAALER
jgi:adenine-specific DNA-methyltransferase